MPSSLYRAFEMDLRAFDNQDDRSIKEYLRYLVEEAYYEEIKNQTTYTHNYILRQKRNNFSVKDELMLLNPLARKYLNINQLLNDTTEYIFQEYLRRKCIPNSFSEVMERTLDYYKDNFDDQITSDVKSFAVRILNNYLYSDNIRVFSSKNYTRAYVLENGKDNIINEIKSIVNIDYSMTNLISDYADLIAQDYVRKNEEKKKYNLGEIEFQVRNEIINARLNQNQKYYLMKELDDGNIDQILIYMPFLDKELVNSYKRAKEIDNNNYSI